MNSPPQFEMDDAFYESRKIRHEGPHYATIHGQIGMRKTVFASFAALLKTNRNLDLEEGFLIAEIFMALKKTGFTAYAAAHREFFVMCAAEELRLRSDLLEALCEFLAEKGIMRKTGPGTFRAESRFFSDQGPIPFLLAYKTACNSLTGLLDGSTTYGKDVARDARYLGTGTKLIFPLLGEIFKTRGIKTVLDLGCGNGAFLLTLAETLPGFRGIGIDIDAPTVEEATAALRVSPHNDSIRIREGDVRHPELFPPDVGSPEALVGMGIFHEFRKDGSLVPLLNRYKTRFPKARLFLVEFDTPGWDELREKPEGPKRRGAAIYRLMHHVSEQGLPQSKDEWRKTLEETAWRVVDMHTGPNRLVAFECQ